MIIAPYIVISTLHPHLSHHKPPVILELILSGISIAISCDSKKMNFREISEQNFNYGRCEGGKWSVVHRIVNAGGGSQAMPCF